MRPLQLSELSSVSSREEGQGLIEYALIIAFVALAVIGSLSAISPRIVAIFGQIGLAP